MDTANDCEYKCVECSKEYKAYKSLWEHNRVHHDGRKVDKMVKNTICEVVVVGKYPCRKCPLIYKHRQTRYAHEKNCTGVDTDQNVELEKVKLIALDKQQNILNIEQSILEKEQSILKSEIEKREFLTTRMNECMNATLKQDERDEQDKEEIDEIFREMEQIFEGKIKIFIEKKEFIKLVKKQETQKKLQTLLSNINQERIQSKFC